MVGEERRVTIAARFDEIRVATRFVEQAARAAGMDESGVHHCQLAVDEACANIIEHGYGGESAAQSISVVCRIREAGCLVIEISDSAPPFDPTGLGDPDVSGDPSRRRPGGWGVYFIRRLMDDVSYRYEQGQNRLLLTRCKLKHSATPERPDVQITTITHPGGVWSVVILGRLDSVSSGYLETVLNTHLASGHKFLIIDLRRVGYVSSAGWKVLIGAWQRVRESRGSIVLAGLAPAVQETLRLIGFDLVFRVFETFDEALANCRKPDID